MVLAWLIITQLLALVSLLPWLMIAGLAVMAFDAGFSWQALAFVGAVWAYPLLPLIASLIAWVAYARGNPTVALVSTSVPLLLAVPLAIYVVYISAQ